MKNINKLLIALVLLQGCSKEPVSFERASLGSLSNWDNQNFEEVYENKNISYFVNIL